MAQTAHVGRDVEMPLLFEIVSRAAYSELPLSGLAEPQTTSGTFSIG